MIKERDFIDDVYKIFYKDIQEIFLCIVPVLLHNLLIDNGVSYIL